MKLFVGLGNPGAKYEGNRHNIGFMALDALHRAHDYPAWKKKFQGYIAEGTIGTERVILLKPDTYMNESGRAVGEAARFHKIEEDDIYVFHDELDLAPSKVKVKKGGGNAGHNGLRSISAHIGNEYVRVRLGIGHPGSKDAVTHFVLNDFAKAERRDWVEPLLDALARAAPQLAKGDAARFLTDVARFTEPDGPQSDKTKGAAHSSTSERDAPDTSPKQARSASKNRNSPHPAGERAHKSQSALVENLKKWLSSRKSSE